MAVLVFPVKRVSMYAELTLSVKYCKFMVLLNCANHSSYSSGSPLCCNKFFSGNGSFFIPVNASAEIKNCLDPANDQLHGLSRQDMGAC